MSATYSNQLRGIALAIVAFNLAPARVPRAGAPAVPNCQTVINITETPPSPTAQTAGSVTVEYGEVITTNPVCLSVEGGQSFAFRVNGVDRTSYFTYGYNSTSGLNEAYGTNVPLVAGMTNTLIATTEGGRPGGDIGIVEDTAQIVITAASVAVTPDNVTADARPSRQNVQSFTVANGSTAASYNLTVACTGTATSCAPSASSISLAAGASSIVTVAYQAGVTGATGTVKLIAAWQSNAAFRDSGSVNVIVRAVGSPVANVDSVNPGTSIERDLCLTIAMGSGAATECGDLRLAYALPTTRTKNKARTPTLLYNSQHAHPYPLIAANVTIPSTIAPPDSVTAKIFFGATERASSKWLGSDFVTGGTRRIVLGFDALTSPTGLYPFTLEVKSWYDADPAYTQTVASNLVIVNRSYLGSGAGWWIAGVEYLYFPGNTQILRVGGDGSTRLYQSAPSTIVNGATRCNWAAAALDRPDTLSSNCAGTYTRHALHGVKVEFDGNGRHVRTINRLSDTTTFTWNANFQRVESIRIPPTAANLAYAFHYNATSGFIDSIVAPPAGTQRRVITVTTNPGMVFNPGWGNMSGGRITALRGPDTSRVQFAYVSTSYRAQSRTDRRGTMRTFTFDAGKRITRDSLAMGTGSTDIVTAFQPQETQGLLGSARPTATDTALVATVMDGPRSDVGDTTRFWLNRWGAPRRIRNALGDETALSFGDSRWPALATLVVSPNGRRQSAAYDARGNLLSATDSSTSRAGVYATTSYRWDPRWDFVTKVDQPERDSVRMAYDTTNGNLLWRQVGPDSTRRDSLFYYPGGPFVGLPRADRYPADARGRVARDSVAYDSLLANVAVQVSPRDFQVRLVNDAIGAVRSSRRQITSVASDTSAWQTDTIGYDGAGRVSWTRSLGPAYGGHPAQESFVQSDYDDEGAVKQVYQHDPLMQPYMGIRDRYTRYAYDRAGRLVTKTEPDGGKDSTIYDAAGNVVEVRTRRGHTLQMDYDALNRLITRRIPGVTYSSESKGAAANNFKQLMHPYPWYPLRTWAEVQTFTYDATNAMLTANGADALVTRDYYANGMLRFEDLKIRNVQDSVFGHTYRTSYEYDLNGRRTAVTYPAQVSPGATSKTIQYVYDSASSELRSVQDLQGNLFAFDYSARGDLMSLTRPGGVVERFGYTIDGLLEGDTLLYGPSRSDPNTMYSSLSRLRAATFVYDGRSKLTFTGNSELLRDTLQASYSALGFLSNSNYRAHGTNIFSGPISTSSNEGIRYDAFGSRISGNIADEHSDRAPLCCWGWTAGTTWSYATDTVRYSYLSGRVRARDRGARDTLEYNAAGDVEYLSQWSTGRFNDRRSYYAADGTLRAADARDVAGDNANRNTFEEYRYDALGRRIWVRARRWCDGQRVQDPIIPNSYQDRQGECNLSLVRRVVWDGSQELGEIQMPGGDSASAADMETDAGQVPVQPRRFPDDTWHDPNRFFGRVAYVFAGQIDRPLAVTRMSYADSMPSGTGFTPIARFPDFTFSPLWTYRGDPEAATLGNGGTQTCVTDSQGRRRCTVMLWPESWYPLNRRQYVPTAWHGALLEDKLDKAGTVYRRNRQYDPSMGQFTQEDPIGLAGGLNLYGFAGGDPVNYSDPFGLCPTCGDEAVDYYAGVATSSNSAVARGAANVGLAMASLWTSDTWKETAMTLASVAPVGRLVGTFKHFGYAEDAANFANGLREGSFATNRATSIKSGAEAVEKLALPGRAAPPNATYRVTPEWWKYVKGPSRVAPANAQPGGGWEYLFPKGTGPGTVTGPTRIP